MGELPSPTESGQGGPIQPSFNRSIHIEARPTHLSSDPGALVLRQLLDYSRGPGLGSAPTSRISVLKTRSRTRCRSCCARRFC